MTYAKVELDKIEGNRAINLVCSSIDLTGIVSGKKAEEAVMQLIERISSDIHTECLDRDEINIDEIRQKVAEIVASQAKDHQILPQDFDFKSAYNLQKIKSNAVLLKTLHKREIVPQETLIPHEKAVHFYESYQQRLIKAMEQENTLRSNLEKAKAPKKIRVSIAKVQQQIKIYQEAITAIETTTAPNSVRIVFPPAENLRNFSTVEERALISLESIDELAEIRSQILLKHKLENEVFQAIQELKASYFTMENFGSMVATQDIEIVNKVILGLVAQIPHLIL